MGGQGAVEGVRGSVCLCLWFGVDVLCSVADEVASDDGSDMDPRGGLG